MALTHRPSHDIQPELSHLETAGTAYKEPDTTELPVVKADLYSPIAPTAESYPATTDTDLVHQPFVPQTGTEVATQQTTDVDVPDQTPDVQPSFMRRHIKGFGLATAGAALFGAGMLTRGGGGVEKVSSAPVPAEAPAKAPEAQAENQTPSKETAVDPSRFAPGSERLVKTTDGFDITYESSASVTLGGSSEQPHYKQLNEDLANYGKSTRKDAENAIIKGGSDLPVAIGECIFIKSNIISGKDGKPHSYYLGIINPIKIQEGNKIIYVANNGSGVIDYAVEKQSGDYRIQYGDDFTVIGDTSGVKYPVTSHWQSSVDVPNMNNGKVWGNGGSIVYKNGKGHSDGRTIVAAPFLISDSSNPDFNLSHDELQQIRDDLLAKTKADSSN